MVPYGNRGSRRCRRQGFAGRGHDGHPAHRAAPRHLQRGGVMKRIYFIKPVGHAGPIKIGTSVSPESRLHDLGAWSPLPLELIGAVEGSIADEFYLHRCFADCHSHREWFTPTPKLIASIEAILSAGTVDAVRSDLKPVGDRYPCYPAKQDGERS